MATLSVVVPAHNAGAYLAAAVGSLLAERLDGLEVVVVDDGSTDASVDAVEREATRVVRQENRGEAAARNAGVRAARGRFVTFLDADDLIAPGGLAARREFLEANPTQCVVGGLPSRLIDEDGATVAEVFERMAARLSFPLRLTDAFYRSGSFFPVSCALYLYRREVFERVGGYDEGGGCGRHAPDCDFHFRLLREVEIPILPVATFARRLHGGNLSFAGAAAKGLSFRPEVMSAVREINRRHGFKIAPEIAPWELDYL